MGGIREYNVFFSEYISSTDIITDLCDISGQEIEFKYISSSTIKLKDINHEGEFIIIDLKNIKDMSYVKFELPKSYLYCVTIESNCNYNSYLLNTLRWYLIKIKQGLDNESKQFPHWIGLNWIAYKKYSWFKRL